MFIALLVSLNRERSLQNSIGRGKCRSPVQQTIRARHQYGQQLHVYVPVRHAEWFQRLYTGEYRRLQRDDLSVQEYGISSLLLPILVADLQQQCWNV